MLCSEWVPSEWESDKNITIIHSTPVHQVTSGEDKRWNKSSIKTFITESIIHNNSSSSEKVFWSESGEKSASDQNSSKLICGWILMWETTADALFHCKKRYCGLWTLWYFSYKRLNVDLFQFLSSPDVNWWTGVLWIIVMFLSALILTAPIHCRASIAETLMQRHISPNLMKKQTHPDLRWPEDEDILS